MKFHSLIFSLFAFTFFSLISTADGTSPSKTQEGLDPDIVTSIVQEVESLYKPLAASQGANFSVEYDLKQDGILASAHRDSMTSYKVIIQNGLLKTPRLTEDGLRIMMCHELGHLFGGAPRRPTPMNWDGIAADDGLSLTTSEAQSDYYSSATCFRKIVKPLSKKYPIQQAPQRIVALCEEAWGEKTEDAMTCQRASLGMLNMLNVVKDFPISLEKMDDSVVEKTNSQIYPPRQCRLDTVVAGALCKRDLPLMNDFYHAKENGCNEGLGKRPTCWYKPE